MYLLLCRFQWKAEGHFNSYLDPKSNESTLVPNADENLSTTLAASTITSRRASVLPVPTENDFQWPYTPLHPVTVVDENTASVGDEPTLYNPFGIPLLILVTKSDAYTSLERDLGYTDEHFDAIQYHLRNMCFGYRAGLVYVSTKEEINTDLLKRYLKHRLFGLPFNLSANVVEPTSIFIPSGWDNAHRLDLLKKNLSEVFLKDDFESHLPRPTTLRGKTPTKHTKGIADGCLATEDSFTLQTVEDEQIFLARMQTQLVNQETNPTGSCTPAEVDNSILLEGASTSNGTQLPQPMMSDKEAVLSSFFNSLLTRKNLTEVTTASNAPAPVQKPASIRKSTSRNLASEQMKNVSQTDQSVVKRTQRLTPETSQKKKGVPICSPHTSPQISTANNKVTGTSNSLSIVMKTSGKPSIEITEEARKANSETANPLEMVSSKTSDPKTLGDEPGILKTKSGNQESANKSNSIMKVSTPSCSQNKRSDSKHTREKSTVVTKMGSAVDRPASKQESESRRTTEKPVSKSNASSLTTSDDKKAGEDESAKDLQSNAKDLKEASHENPNISVDQTDEKPLKNIEVVRKVPKGTITTRCLSGNPGEEEMPQEDDKMDHKVAKENQQRTSSSQDVTAKKTILSETHSNKEKVLAEIETAQKTRNAMCEQPIGKNAEHSSQPDPSKSKPTS
ncbi:hypothetical protein PHET_07009 [Paragonimus heterotremus]|uniref:Dynein light intermediate chain n=1 Tax=Paragonimus heterotremus TaxID=100268 RepID=A0A8J4TDG3_9TREM|nr:hypothetical protein PHET_07009 [Paragonimus heterotremus]